MTKNQIIEELFNGKNFNDCINRMEPDHLREDLKMEVALIICEWPEDKIIKLHLDKALEFFVVRVILNQIQSSTSPFFRKYRLMSDSYNEQEAIGFFGAIGEGTAEARHRSNVVERATDSIAKQAEDLEERHRKEGIEEKALREIENLYWYNAELVKLYMVHGNYRAIEEQTGIPFVSCYHTIRKSFKELKQRVL